LGLIVQATYIVRKF